MFGLVMLGMEIGLIIYVDLIMVIDIYLIGMFWILFNDMFFQFVDFLVMVVQFNYGCFYLYDFVMLVVMLFWIDLIVVDMYIYG